MHINQCTFEVQERQLGDINKQLKIKVFISRSQNYINCHIIMMLALK